VTALSIVMPVYNEAATIDQAIGRVLAVEYPCAVELIVVDDGSSDDTARLLAAYPDRGVTVLRHPVNRGKGAAVRTGVEQASGTHVLILDADLEYTPADIPRLLMPVINGLADHVFGTRVFGLNTRFTSYKFAMGGRFTTTLANVLYDSCLTDMHTCLKLVPLDHFRALALSQDGFGLDTELTAMMLRAGVRPYEVPITYNGRTLDEGKKITWRDGWECVRILGTVKMRRPVTLPSGPFEPPRVVVPMPAPARFDIDHGDEVLDAAP
jgi:dolichol-phosphate hexosyltransferase